LEKRRKKREKYTVSSNDVNAFASIMMATTGWQVQQPKKVLKKLQHEAQKQIRMVECEGERLVNIFLLGYG